MQGEKLETGKDGGSLWTRPYVPRGAKKLGNREDYLLYLKFHEVLHPVFGDHTIAEDSLCQLPYQLDHFLARSFQHLSYDTVFHLSETFVVLFTFYIITISSFSIG